jgi:hypothetical protein
MFIAALVTIAELCYQLRCPTTNKWVKKIWYIYIYIYTYICIYIYIYIHHGILLSHKENEITWFAGKWMKLEIIMLSEISQAQNVKYHMFSVICGS